LSKSIVGLPFMVWGARSGAASVGCDTTGDSGACACSGGCCV